MNHNEVIDKAVLSRLTELVHQGQLSDREAEMARLMFLTTLQVARVMCETEKVRPTQVLHAVAEQMTIMVKTAERLAGLEEESK